MNMKIAELGQETYNHVRHVGEATLDGVPGRGTLQVVRNTYGTLVSLAGTWYADQPEDLRGLEQSVEQGRPVRYDGKLDDPNDSGHDRIVTEVLVTSSATYDFGALDGGAGGQVRTLFNFKPTGQIVSS